jgi:hypothetical protein
LGFCGFDWLFWLENVIFSDRFWELFWGVFMGAFDLNFKSFLCKKYGGPY